MFEENCDFWSYYYLKFDEKNFWYLVIFWRSFNYKYIVLLWKLVLFIGLVNDIKINGFV